MFFDQLSDLPAIASRTSCVIFALPPNTKLPLKNALYFSPDTSKVTPITTVDQVREIGSLSSHHEKTDHYYILTAAETMNEPAANAFLKTLEEPTPFCHFVLLTMNPFQLLPTIRSRAQIFYPRRLNCLNEPPTASPKTLALAKKLIAATPSELPALAADLTKSKTKTRENVLEIISVAIELLYKSYFKTQNPKFLTKLPNFLQLHDAVRQNGHIKLHLVADLC